MADVLADVLRAPVADPLAPEWVVVGSRPLERWLAARLAERLGVCAHVRFPSPSTVLEEVLESTLGVTRATVRGWRAERLTWRLLATLPALLDDPAFAKVFVDVRRYLHRDGGAADPRVVDARALTFARRLGECFHRYASCDPARVRRWDAGADDGWQSTLWRALHAGDAPTHPAALAAAAEARLRSGGRAALPERIVWVAQPGTPMLHVRTMVALAAAGVDVHALVALPPRTASTSPSLRTSLGRLGDDLDALIERACAELDITPTHVAHVAHAALAIAPRSALDVLRAELLGAASDAPVPLASDDASWRVHACHGPMRQAEVLRDELLALLDADPTLRPRDVLVLTPDVALVAPLIEAAFAATGGAAPLPLRVLDRPARRGNAAADVALRVLALAASRVNVVEVLDLVTLPAVAARFGLDAGAEDVLRRWVRESGVRWGMDGDDRAASHDQPNDEEHTWRFGLERLLLGWGLPGDGRTLWEGALPVDAVEGSEAERLGRFAEACARTFDAVRAVRGARTLREWRDVLRAQVVDALVDDGPDHVLARRAWRDALDALVEEGTGCDRPVEPAAVRLLLAARFDEPAGGEGSAGSVTLARLAPGRVVPARVIALVGLDDGAWPRARGGAGFDLLARERVPGAADANAEDRQRLLEAILAAGERLIVTYTGRTLDTNEPVPPAVPVGELLDALDARCTCDARDADGTPLHARTVVERAHPMQPFGPGAFGGDGEAPRSHDATHLAGALALRAPRGDAPAFLTRALPAPAERVVTVDALAAFLAAPARAVVSGRLGVWLGAPEALEIDDPLDLDGLDRWTLRSDVLARLLDDEDPAPSLALQRAAGRLPHGPLGHVAFGAAVAEARTVTRLADARKRAVRTDGVDVDRTIGGWRLVGRVGPLFDGGLFEVHAGALRAKQLLSFWVRHLALHLAEGPGAPASTLVGLPKRTPTDGRLAFAPVSDAEARLGALLALYDEAMRRPLPLLPDASLAYVEAFTPKRTPEDAHREGLAKAIAAWNDRRDAWTERLLGEQPFGDGARFGELSRAVWEPVLACLGARAPEAAS
ncbi:RecBCD enzyme subunit RecC [Roseisolibacter agri]|uniref:RecBCD enzyme subunit RecC n=1 Tax=Roseisolibacter agri TaxID=2014610 RepID=A0AA37V8N1_9BACT|nr:RecBCD enzyme subunit RecC [Roseisolibacter agri]